MTNALSKEGEAMQNIAYYNGEIGAIEELRVPMTDRGFYFGDGIYDVAYARNHIIYALDEHLDRFYRCLAEIDINEPMPREQLRALLCELSQKLDDGEQLVYWQGTRGSGLRVHAYEENDTPGNLTVMIRPAKIKPVYTPIRLISAEDKRYLYCNLKTICLLPSVLTSQMAQRAGVDETVLHRGDRVTECAHSNLSILADGKLITHPADCHILAGTGRAHLVLACREMGIAVEERAFTLEEMMGADEVLITSASALCVRVSEVDGRAVGGRDAERVKRLQDALMEDFLKNTEG
jgi:D-alanine transaminase